MINSNFQNIIGDRPNGHLPSEIRMSNWGGGPYQNWNNSSNQPWYDPVRDPGRYWGATQYQDGQCSDTYTANHSRTTVGTNRSTKTPTDKLVADDLSFWKDVNLPDAVLDNLEVKITAPCVFPRVSSCPKRNPQNMTRPQHQNHVVTQCSPYSM